MIEGFIAHRLPFAVHNLWFHMNVLTFLAVNRTLCPDHLLYNFRSAEVSLISCSRFDQVTCLPQCAERDIKCGRHSEIYLVRFVHVHFHLFLIPAARSPVCPLETHRPVAAPGEILLLVEPHAVVMRGVGTFKPGVPPLALHAVVSSYCGRCHLTL